METIYHRTAVGERSRWTTGFPQESLRGSAKIEIAPVRFTLLFHFVTYKINFPETVLNVPALFQMKAKSVSLLAMYCSSLPFRRKASGEATNGICSGKRSMAVGAITLLAMTHLVCQHSQAATVAWQGSGGSTAWYTSGNWSPTRTSVSWLSTDIAQFNNTGTATTAGIDLGAGSLSIGAVEVTSLRKRALAIGTSSATGNAGTLRLNGTTVNGTSNVILRNAATGGSTLTIENTSTGKGTMSLMLGGTLDHLISIEADSGITISSTISGSGKRIVLQGGGSAPLLLTGANTYSGGTTVAGANQLRLGSNSVVGAGGALTSGPVGTGTLTLGNGASLRADSGVARAIQNNLSLSGSITLGATSKQTGTLTFNSTDGTRNLTNAATVSLTGNTTLTTNVNTTIANVISGNYGLTKAGTGSGTRPGSDTLVLSGANTYIGATTIDAGKLILNGSTNSASAVNVSAGTATGISVATLAGIGTVGGNLTLTAESAAGFKNGGILAPTASASGTKLSVTGSTTFNTGSIFEWNLNAAANDSGVTNQGNYGQLDGTGAITLASGSTGAVFKIVLGSNTFTDTFWDTNKTWNNIFNGAGATTDMASIFSSFGGVNINSAGIVDGQGQFTFSGTDTLTWSAVPEPTSALAGLLLATGLLRRRRN